MRPDRLQPGEADTSDLVVNACQEAPLGQPDDAVEDVDAELRGRSADRLGLDVVEGLFEDRQSREETLERRLEQAVAPGHGLIHRPLAIRQVARAGPRQRPVLAQSVADGDERQHAGAGRAELDGQRQAVELSAILGHDLVVGVGEPQVGPHAAGAVDEESHGVRARGQLAIDVHRSDHVLLLSPQAEGHPTGDDDAGARRNGEQVSDDVGGGDDLLEVVEDEQQLACAHVGSQPIGRGPERPVQEADAAGDLGADLAGLADGLEVDEAGAIDEVARMAPGQLEGQRRLARAAWAGQSQQPRLTEQLVEGLELVLAPDEGRQSLREPVRRLHAAAQRREVAGQAGHVELEEALGLGQVLEPVGAQVAQAPPTHRVIADEGARGVRDDDLTAPAGGGDAGSPIDLEAAVVVADPVCGSAVDADAGLEGVPDWPGLRTHRALDGDGRRPRRRGRVREDREDGIALGADDLAVVRADGVADDVLMLQVELVVAWTQRAHQRHGALEVRAQERDRALWQ